MDKPITIDEIRSIYPEQWVLVGNPVLSSPDQIGLVASKMQSRIVLYSSTDKREIASKANDLTRGVERFACIFTDEVPKKCRFWL